METATLAENSLCGTSESSLFQTSTNGMSIALWEGKPVEVLPSDLMLYAVLTIVHKPP